MTEQGTNQPNLLYTFQIGHSPTMLDLTKTDDAGEAGYVVRVGVDQPEKNRVEQVNELFLPVKEAVQKNGRLLEFDVVLPFGRQYVIVVYAKDAQGNASKAIQYVDHADGTIPPLPPGFKSEYDLVPIRVTETSQSMVLETVEPTIDGKPVDREAVAAQG